MKGKEKRGIEVKRTYREQKRTSKEETTLKREGGKRKTCDTEDMP